jgi:hypothetical protein
MVLFRALGWLLLALALAVAVHDLLFWWSDGAFHPMTLRELWLQLDYASLQSLERFVARHLTPVLWTQLAGPILRLPVLPIFVIVGLLLIWLGQRREERSEPSGFILASRPRRRRRRSSSLS